MECPAGSYCPGGTVISPCPGSSSSNAGSSQIADCKCDPGHTGPDGGECSPCAIGTFKPASGPQACTQCPTNSLSPEGSTQLVSCKCNSGHTGPDGGECSACAIGTYKFNFGPQACMQCPTNSSSPRASIQLTDCTCIAGYTGPDGGACSPCARGEYKDVTGSSECVACSANSDAPAGSDAISDCQCVAGYTGPDGGACTACAAGTFKPSAGSASCSNTCPANSISEPASDEISDCKCNAGYTRNEGGVCTACGAGFFKASVGDEACTACPDNMDSVVVASVTDTDCQCNKGYAGADGGTCQACAAGSYKASMR